MERVYSNQINLPTKLRFKRLLNLYMFYQTHTSPVFNKQINITRSICSFLCHGTENRKVDYVVDLTEIDQFLALHR